MNRWLVLTMAAALTALGTAGCGGICGDVCDHIASCDPDLLLSASSSCEWDDDEDKVNDDCFDACEEVYDSLSDSEAEEVDACIDCVWDDVGDSCSESGMEDAIDDCDRECDDNDVGEFWYDFFEEWNPDLDCPEEIYPPPPPG